MSHHTTWPNAQSRTAMSLDAVYHEQRQRLLTDQASLTEIEEGIDFSLSSAMNTAQLGADALVELKRQHHEMKGAQQGLSRIGDGVSKANRLTFLMILREWKIRIILALVAIVQLVFILSLLYLRWVNPLLKCMPGPAKRYLSLCWGSLGRNSGHCECLSWP
ncbi:hypothetical protein J8273_2486 [Carpediemonas membranifera]|uniref:Uncharacterized protein n=1 Tax=Carpediemonas membranifera TaxID=201153 RepID=A0A8J6B9P5_9EUKA|nr:hypothetical protein J8273_2486 [Carpediemonas membranifera]|eukprot:KAG9396134.1 hypothetical protein J8273_2486 [Carpediemonas membranifera]